ncbi:MAG: TetR/AcrR family transcriptional regulator [Candidatus Dormibacteria bacterium]
MKREVSAEASGEASPDGAPSAGRALRADAAHNREVLLEAASAAFSERGAEVPMEDVARRAGVGIGTLYRHFPTREALVEAVFRHEVEALVQSADELLATLPPEQALKQWMQLFVGHVATKRGMLAVLRPILLDNPRFSGETKGLVTAAATKILRAGIAAGSVRPDVDGADLLRAVSGICMSTDEGHPEAANRLVGLLFDGLRRSPE